MKRKGMGGKNVEKEAEVKGMVEAEIWDELKTETVKESKAETESTSNVVHDEMLKQSSLRVVRKLERGMWELQRDPEFETLLSPLEDEEFKGLKNGIKRDGCTDSLYTWNGVIVDGHNRYNICWELGCPFEVTELDFESRDEVILWIIERQLGRRNIPPFLKAELLERVEKIQAEEALKRKKTGRRNKNHMSTLTYEPPQNRTTRHKIAQLVGVSDGTMHKINALKKRGDEETKQKLRKGKITINKAYTELRKRENGEKAEVVDEDASSTGFDDSEKKDQKKHSQLEADPLVLNSEPDNSFTEVELKSEEELNPIVEMSASCEESEEPECFELPECPVEPGHPVEPERPEVTERPEVPERFDRAECSGESQVLAGSAVPNTTAHTASELNATEYSFDRITKYPGITVLDHPIEVPTGRRNPLQGTRDFLFVQGQVHFALKNMIKEMEVGLNWIRDDDKKRIPELREMFRRACAQVDQMLSETEEDSRDTDG